MVRGFTNIISAAEMTTRHESAPVRGGPSPPATRLAPAGGRSRPGLDGGPAEPPVRAAPVRAGDSRMAAHRTRQRELLRQQRERRPPPGGERRRARLRDGEPCEQPRLLREGIQHPYRLVQ